MEVFRDLIVTATPEQMSAVITAIQAAPLVKWSLNTALTSQSSNTSQKHGRPRVFHFTRGDTDGRVMTLALAEKGDEPGKYFVPNIVPDKPPMLTRGEYNATLEEFADQVFRPAASSVGVNSCLTESHAELEHWLSADTAAKLRQFSATANRLVGAAHPDDRAKWNAFVLSAHQERSSLDTATLERWLVEVERWDDDVAERLSTEYHYGRELLGYSASRGGI